MLALCHQFLTVAVSNVLVFEYW